MLLFSILWGKQVKHDFALKVFVLFLRYSSTLCKRLQTLSQEVNSQHATIKANNGTVAVTYIYIMQYNRSNSNDWLKIYYFQFCFYFSKLAFKFPTVFSGILV